jgi:zinc protease
MSGEPRPSSNCPYTKRTLDNGLDVIVHEDHHVPIVAVNLWYHVGSKNEQPGPHRLRAPLRTPDVRGSANHDSGLLRAAAGGRRPVERLDQHRSHQLLGSGADEAVDLALWMESDRMAYLLPALTKQRFETQRDVVLNERRQNYENRPYGLAMMAVVAALFPPDHPYNWMTIGSADDIRAMEFEDVREFFRTYYHPSNASLVLAGDVATGLAFELADRYFGDIPAGVRPAPVQASAAIDGERRLVLEDRVELPRLYFGWHSRRCSPLATPSWIWAADLLANGKTARLYQTLVYDRRVALDVSAAQQSREMAGFFVLAVTAAPGASLADLAAAVDDEIARLHADGPTGAEMERAEAQAEAQFVYHLQTVGGFGGKSDQLNAYNVLQGDPGFFSRDLDRYRLATRDGVRDAAREYLNPARRVVLSVVPRDAPRTRCPAQCPCRCPDGPAASRPLGTTGARTAACLHVPRHPAPRPVERAPRAHGGAHERAGRHLRPPGRRRVGCRPGYARGLASLVADLVDEGTGDLSAIEVSDALARIGGDYDVDTGSDAISFSLTTLARSRIAARNSWRVS